MVYESVDSTNKLAKSLAIDGALHGTCVAANTQTAGRGRLGRSFFSPPQSGIYLSIILRPEIDITKATLITTMASVATATAISDVCGIETDIKWVNDLYYQGKKVCGILTEAVTNFETGKIDSIVVGIGINSAPPNCDLPDEIKDIYGFIPGSFSFSRNQLTAEVISRVMELCSAIEDGDYSFIEEYRRRSMVIGKKIDVFKGGIKHDPFHATAIDVDKFGGLTVKYDNGKTETLTSGEVSIRLND
jgi:BirA family biotin operon repressor/biotin-[acetyl-CoA-carboxylase] ligase